MNGLYLDDVLRTLTQSRRSALIAALTAGLFGRSTVEAKKKRKRKHKKQTKVQPPTPNEFGCLEVGDACVSEDDCCSGVCDGKTCRAHDVGTCGQGQSDVCAIQNPDDAVCVREGLPGLCFRTTAGSDICMNRFLCAPCQRDADCLALGFPQGSACVPLTGDLACDDLCQGETSRTACVFAMF
jgi:hypothetical protein